jgi:CoA-transferase family III
MNEAAYARHLLADLGSAATVAATERHPALAWAESGAMALTGATEGPAEICPAPIASCAAGALAALSALSGTRLPFDGAKLLGERAASAGLGRQGAVAPGSSCRLIACTDGWLALNLARDEDWALLPAWLEDEIAPEWPALETALQHHETAALVARGRLLGLALAPLAPPPEVAPPWHRILATGPERGEIPSPAPLVIDLTALWAGPLAGHLLGLLGARVIKVESLTRPDGARRGPAGFYDLLNAGKASVALDFASEAGRTQLRALIGAADIVLESTRPRALEQLGFDAAALVAERPGLTWVSLTGYGRLPPQAGWVAFGDDAGVASGLSALLPQPDGKPIFCADAIADPLTGLHAALAAWHGYLAGQSRLIALSLQEVAAHCCSIAPPADPAEWRAVLDEAGIAAAPPQARRAAGTARPLGADTAAILAALPC